MRPKKVAEFLQSIVRCPDAPAVFIWGPPGVGKSDVCRQVAVAEGISFIDLRLALMDPTDLRGIPVPADGKAVWLPPSALPIGGRGILFLDGLTLAPPLVQSAAYQLVLDRRIGEYCLPNGWVVVAAGNKVEHGAPAFRMAPALCNRFVHIEFEVGLDDWREWALKHGIAPVVVEFISYRPSLLFQFDPRRHDNAFPTPRSWEFVSIILENQSGLAEETVHEVIAGTVGAGAAAEFRAFRQLRDRLPPVEGILEGCDVVPEEIDITWALATALAFRAAPTQYERLLQYSRKLPAEVAALLVKLLAVKDRRALESCPSWPGWAAREYADLIISGS